MPGIPNTSADTKILLDGGDPDETARIKNLLGFLDEQTTNPTLVAKNPEVQTRIASGHKLSRKEQELEYKKIVQGISSPIPYRILDLGARWETFNLGHELTDKGIEKFVWDYRSTLAPAA